ncbi:MAG: prepilin-type N-terminal cleavage/methylation domain-containing protein [Candidatus Omnitrophica bacterium]|nr:prepilin-type N-terminal cleavage/methylation domain-containing protein [Candidatus Omnitrophota bacterium]
MIRLLKSKRGFTLSEVIVAAVIMSLAVAGSYSSYFLARMFGHRFQHKTYAINRANELADYLRHHLDYDNPDLTNGNHIYPAAAYNVLDVSSWDIVVNKEVRDLAAQYNVSQVWFNNGVEMAVDGSQTPDQIFKKITVTVTWDEIS